MKPNYWFDVVVREPIYGVRRVLATLHAQCRQTGRPFSIDLPALRAGCGTARRLGNIVRIFCDSREDADFFAKSLESDIRLRELARVRRVNALDFNTHDGNWIVLRRLRVSKRREPKNRRRDIDLGQRLPFIMTRSKTNGHAYTLTFLRQAAPKRRMDGDGHPNSYGLSGEHPVELPDLGYQLISQK